jgi:uncharacterized membrane protein/protein-disulfide isomerase
MSFIKDLISPIQNCEEIAIRFCSLLNIKVTDSTLIKDLQEHPDYPSLLSTSDVLKGYGVDNLSLKTTKDNLANLPLPFITQVIGTNTRQHLFAIVMDINTENIVWYNPESKKTETITIGDFSKSFTGFVQIAKVGERAGEKDFQLKHNKEKSKNAITTSIAATIPLLAIGLSVLSFWQVGFVAGIFPVVYILLTLIGVLTAVLLLLYEVDQYNPTLQKVCHAGKKTNCAAILNSGASKIFGVSWAAIGFTYFAGILFALLIGGVINPALLFIASWLNVLALPYVAYSVYYQWKIAKQWCPMCLAVQGVLLLQFITALSGGFHSAMAINELNLNNLLTFTVCFILPFFTVLLLVPALEKAKESKQNKISLQRLKHNPQIFDALLAKQKQITTTTEGLGITLGNPDAKYKLIKVCNPYCGPCAGAHPIIGELMHNNPDLQLQVIFTASPEEGDSRNAPVKHLLAITEKADTLLTEQALDDWYLAESKDYEAFAAKYPMNGQLKQQTEKVKAMHEWCNKEEIAATPTFFINGHQLPDMYSVADLKYFLSI